MNELIPIIPAVIPASEADLLWALEQFAGLPEVHIDVVDGVFVKTVSWPYTPAGEPRTLAPWLDRFSLEVDLMVATPIPAAEAWLAAGADALVFHSETISVATFREFADATPISVGICALLDTPTDELAPYLPYADYVQMMGIATIGSQGQPFDERVFARIDWLRTVAPQLPISIDGSVNQATLPKIVQYHLDRYIVGSAIIKQPNPKQAYLELMALAQSTVSTP